MDMLLDNATLSRGRPQSGAGPRNRADFEVVICASAHKLATLGHHYAAGRFADAHELTFLSCFGLRPDPIDRANRRAGPQFNTVLNTAVAAGKARRCQRSGVGLYDARRPARAARGYAAARRRARGQCGDGVCCERGCPARSEERRRSQRGSARGPEQTEVRAALTSQAASEAGRRRPPRLMAASASRADGSRFAALRGRARRRAGVAAERAQKVGPNDRCPCGSGKKLASATGRAASLSVWANCPPLPPASLRRPCHLAAAATARRSQALRVIRRRGGGRRDAASDEAESGRAHCCRCVRALVHTERAGANGAITTRPAASGRS